YREQPADLQTQAGSKDHSRWLEQPEIRAVTKGEAPGGNFPPVLLAELMLDGSGSITDVNSNVRQYSGLRLPGPSADGPTLRADANGLVQLAGNLSVTGNVGIGTTAAPKAFQVALPESSKGGVAPGTGVTIAGGDNANIELRGTGTPYIDFAKDASTTDYHARIRLTATDKLAIEGANVGIGTTDPGTNKLKVTGNTYLDGTLTVTGNTGIGTSGSLSFGSQVRQMINLLSTNYGIGVQSNTQYFRTDKNFAWYKGGAHSDAELTAGTNGTVQMVIKDGNVGIGTDDPKSKLTINSKIGNDGSFSTFGDAQLTIFDPNPNGGSSPNGTRDVLHLVREGVAAQAYGNKVSLALGRYEHPGNTASRTQLDIKLTDASFNSHNTIMSLRSNGNVGIGTTGPTGKLDVQGSVYVGTGRNNENYKLVIRGPNSPGNDGSSQDLSYEFTNAGSVKIRAYRGSSWDTYLQLLTNAVGANSDNPQVRLHINHDGNVGIGTSAAPAAKLQVAGGAIMPAAGNSESAGILFPKNPGGGAGDAAWIRYYSRTGEATTFEIGTSNDADDHIALMPSGGVGIGTSTPQATLHVAGSLRVDGGNSVSGIPIIDFQSKRQNFSGHTGSRKQLAYTFTFSRPVTKAEAMLRSWYLVYQNREYVKEMGVFIDNGGIQITGNTVTVLVDFYLRDSTGSYDDAYNGDAIVVVIAQLSQAV
ncbi:MAG TPA: hypothetical protein VLU73_11570, partial [Methylococcaceae bacterium]|nr:hypothetical protein [Methylococcaceae bacterium]